MKKTYARKFKATKKMLENSMLYLMVSYPAIKIGYASNIANRMKDYRTCNPYAKIIDVIPGTMKDEKAYHKKMKKMLEPLDPTSALYEWYKIPSDKNEYKKILEQGFSYFN